MGLIVAFHGLRPAAATLWPGPVVRVALATSLAVGVLVILTAPAFASSTVQFRSPSGKIICVIGPGEGLCFNALTEKKQATEDCGGPTAVRIYTAGRASYGTSCGGAPNVGVLRYGRSIRRGSIRCTSRTSGVTCKSLRTGHGFRLSSRAIRRF